MCHLYAIMRRHDLETPPITGPSWGKLAFGRWILLVISHYDETLLLYCRYHGQTTEKNSSDANDSRVPILDAMTPHDVTEMISHL